MKNRPEKTVLFLDRVDYLLSKHGFKKVLSFIQSIREIAYLSDLIFILSLDPGTCSEKEFIFLEKETNTIKAQEKLTISEYLLEIMKVIYDYNIIGEKPSYTQVGNKTSVSRPTLRKRIKRLITFGYILEIQKGRSKYLELTEKGKAVLF